MKVTLYKYIGILGAVLMFSACNKAFLERPPLNQVSEVTFWNRAEDVSQAVNGVYSQLGGVPIHDEGATDNAHAQYPWESYATQLSAGSLTTNVEGNWNFIAIRRCNYFLENADRAAPVLDAALLNRFKAEVRFLRVYFYANLVNKYGDVPLLTSTLAIDEVNVPRTPKAQVVDFMLTELEEIATLLPEEYTGGTDNQPGRITRGAALAMSARINLYEGNWTAAAAAAQRVMALGYSLFTISSENELDRPDNYAAWVDFANEADSINFKMGLRSYEGLFHQANEGNAEVILDRQYIPQVDANSLNTFLPAGNMNGWSSVTPTQSLVDAYDHYRTGMPIVPVSREQRATWYSSQDARFSDEYRNRDPRFYATVLFNGAPWNFFRENFVFQWAPGASNMSQTGYNFRKLVDPAAFRARPVLDNHANGILIRYAEMLLTYAEAANEESGPSAAVYAALDLIRRRAGMPPVNRVVYSSQQTLRNFIRNERRVELALEGHRFMDIRRWRIASQVMVDIYDLNNSVAQNRTWNDRFYLLPVPQSQIDLAQGVLTQNLGY
ncbi:RagB/SusD family nutrient uptake outer membrane protein [Sphingobacterium griseoflavum]|uniref:Carbohydrate-binding protein SusD n=1 Tax=Sphingobacterium griseoflavum TaxID=1474952 RepID=A0ABQ3HT56_9SPHI|nr:RagB/SusD family nutrient uptake outer membrane protein [Sphingobacterium griseoflavum]GHE31148.1 hypothetical protein GCM10017764_12770 [Sphingobacterium griseoflavum]